MSVYNNYSQIPQGSGPYGVAYGTAPGPYGRAMPGPSGGELHAQELFQGPLKSPFARGSRRGWGLAMVAVCLFVPWGIFAGVCALQTFSIKYQNAALSTTLTILLFVLVLVFGYFALAAVRRRTEGFQEPAWLVFLFVTSLISWIVALVCGQNNFIVNMKPYFQVTSMNIYTSVDASRYRGQQLMDAGRIIFKDSRIDLTKSMGFRNSDMYCVAPITAAQPSQRSASYDFWAVGLNCCSGHGADFHCGEYNNPQAHSGLRLMNDGQREYFRLAVQQSEAAYNIVARHPIFLYWMQDPVAEINSYQDDGYKYYLLGICAFFVFQLFIVVVAVIAFPKMTS